MRKTWTDNEIDDLIEEVIRKLRLVSRENGWSAPTSDELAACIRDMLDGHGLLERTP